MDAVTPPVGDGVGYGIAAVETIQALQRKKIKVSYNTFDPLVHISFVQPDFYSGHPDQYRVGYTPWESSELPKRWIEQMNNMNETWTTSNYCKKVFEDHGVERVTVVPHGIDPDVWKIQNRYQKDRFVFLHVGGPTERKGGQRVVDAFLELFGDNESCFLILKSGEPTETRYYDKNGQFLPASAHARIHVVDYRLDVWQLADLYMSADCLVYPTNGEGFGFIPFQGIATGLPTICTNATGCADYAELSIPLKSNPAPGVGVHLGEWVEPDLQDLRENMRWVYDNYDAAVNKAVNAAKIIHNTQTWDHIATQITDILGDKIYKKV